MSVWNPWRYCSRDLKEARIEVRAYHSINADIASDLPNISESLNCDIVNADDLNVSESTYAVPDVRVDDTLNPWSESLISHGHLALLCAPLVAKQKRLGVLIVMWRDAHVPSRTEVEFLSAMAGHIANAVQNAILYEEAKGKRELGILLNASRLFGATLDTQDLLDQDSQDGCGGRESRSGGSVHVCSFVAE